MRLKLVSGLFALLFSSLGMWFVVTDVPFDAAPPEVPSDLQSTMMEIPVDGDITTMSANENLYISAGELYRSGGFRGVSQGSTVSMGVSQGIAAQRTVKGDTAFKQSVSYSTFVKLGEQRYVKGTTDYIVRQADKVSALDNVTWANTATPISKETYQERYGYSPTGLTGYILNDNTIVSSELVSQENGLYTFHYVLDVNSAPYFVLFEMRTSAGTEAFPQFLRAELYVTMDANWQVKSVSTDCEYKVAMLGGTLCKESLTETFYDIGQVEEVDNTDFFSQYFGKAPEEIGGGAADPLTELMSIFQPYISEGEQLNVDLLVKQASNQKNILSGKVNALIDIENTDNIVVNAKLNGVADFAYKKGTLYIQSGDFRGSATVDDLMSAISAITSVAGMPSIDLGGMVDLDSLMSGMTVVKDEVSSTIKLNLQLAGITLQGAINADIDSNGNYQLTDITANVAGFDIVVTPCAQWEVMSTDGQFNDLTGIFDVIKDGVIAFDIKVADITNLHIQYDLKSGVLNADGGDLRISLQQNTLYLAFGEVKLQLALSDIPELADQLSSLLSSLGIGGLDLGSLGLENIDISALLDGVYFESTSDRAELGIKLSDTIQLHLALQAIDGRWTFAEAGGSLGEYDIVATPSEVKDYQPLDTQQFVNVADIVSTYLPAVEELLGADSYGVTLSGSVTVDGNKFDYSADVRLDKALNVNADFQVTYGNTAILHGFVGYYDGIIFVDVNGVRTAIDPSALGLTTNSKSGSALDLDKLQQAISQINPTLGKVVESVLPLVESLSNIDLSQLDLAAFVESFAMQDGALTIGINAQQLGLGSTQLVLTAGDNIALSISDFAVGDITFNLNASVVGDVEVTQPNANDYKLGLRIDINDIAAFVSVDLVNMQVSVNADFGGAQLLAKLKDNTVYMQYGNIKLKFDIADIDSVMQYVNKLIDMPDRGSLGLDLYEILGNIRLSLVGDNAGITADIMGIPLSVKFDNVNNELVLGSINATLGNINVSVATTDSAEFVDFATDNTFIDIVDVVIPVLDSIMPIVESKQFSTDFNVALKAGNNNYTIVGTLSYGNTISVDMAMYLDDLKVLQADAVLADNVLYVKVNDVSLAVPLNGAQPTQKSAVGDINSVLESLKGYNVHLDSVLDVVANLVNNVQSGNFEFGKLVKSLTYQQGSLVCVLDGDVLGTTDLRLLLNANDGLQIAVDRWTIGTVTLGMDARVYEGATDVVVNPEDYQLNIVVKLDEVNTIYGNIDVLNSVYRFKMGDMYLEYSDNVIKINCKDITVKGNIEQLQLIIDKLTELANSRLIAGNMPDGDTVSILSKLFSLDIKEILNSIQLTRDGNIVKISGKVMGNDMSVNIVGGNQPQFGYISIALLGKDIHITTETTSREYLDFDTVGEAVEIEQIFNDYYPTLEKLVSADGWHFDLAAEISVGADRYLLEQGSSLDFLYRNAQDFHLKGKFVIKKWNGTQFVDYMSLEAIYLNERIYIDYNGLRITIAQEAIEKSIGLYDQLVTVVPQIGQLINELLSAKDQVEGNSHTMDYSKILTEASYTDGVFTLGIDGGVLLDKLGVITLVISRSQDGLNLNMSDLTYDNITVHNFALNVVPATEQQCLANIGTPDIGTYFNLDSLYELLSAFVTTADNNTFRIYGTATAKLVVTIDIGIELYVDIDDDGFVFVTLQISREKLGELDFAGAAFNDYGGNSYLHYNGREDTITIVRDSYVFVWDWFNSGIYMEYRNYYAKVTTEQFTADIVTYLMEMINFKGWIRDQITGAINSEGQGNSYEIKDVWTGYGYSAQDNGGQFVVNANLAPIDSNLGPLTVAITHDQQFNLTGLSGNISMLSDWCTVTFNLTHVTPTYGIATDYAVNETSWKGVGTV